VSYMFTSGQGNTEVVCQFLDSSDYKYQPSQETSTGPMLTVCNTQRVCNYSDCDHQVFVMFSMRGRRRKLVAIQTEAHDLRPTLGRLPPPRTTAVDLARVIVLMDYIEIARNVGHDLFFTVNSYDACSHSDMGGCIDCATDALSA
jgi:hypothetical protein